jgi:molecular chaperone HscB
MPDKAMPSKCNKCSRPMSEVLVCDSCHTLNPEGLLTDYFALLGLPRTYLLDDAELQRKFFAINRHVHPDHQDASNPEMQQLSLAMSAAVNNAYRTLKDPATRAAYLLELMGGKSSAADKSVPDDFLNTMMMMQEELADAKASGNHDQIGRLKDVLTRQRDGLIAHISELFAQYEESVSCEAVRQDFLDEIRRLLNAISYVRKLLSQTA